MTYYFINVNERKRNLSDMVSEGTRHHAALHHFATTMPSEDERILTDTGYFASIPHGPDDICVTSKKLSLIRKMPRAEVNATNTL
ncbi:hypothetical protein NFJ02_31g79240 [Pycnococcus provasolii]